MDMARAEAAVAKRKHSDEFAGGDADDLPRLAKDAPAGLEPRQYLIVNGLRYVTPYEASTVHWPKANYVGLPLCEAMARMFEHEHRSVYICTHAFALDRAAPTALRRSSSGHRRSWTAVSRSAPKRGACMRMFLGAVCPARCHAAL